MSLFCFSFSVSFYLLPLIVVFSKAHTHHDNLLSSHSIRFALLCIARIKDYVWTKIEVRNEIWNKSNSLLFCKSDCASKLLISDGTFKKIHISGCTPDLQKCFIGVEVVETCTPLKKVLRYFSVQLVWGTETWTSKHTGTMFHIRVKSTGPEGW